LSLLQGSFAKETYHFKEPTNRSHPISSNASLGFALVGSLKSYVSFAKEPYKRDDSRLLKTPSGSFLMASLAGCRMQVKNAAQGVRVSSRCLCVYTFIYVCLFVYTDLNVLWVLNSVGDTVCVTNTRLNCVANTQTVSRD